MIGEWERALVAQSRAELTLTMRRGESVLVTLFVPAVLLIFFASLNLAPSGSAVEFLLPGVIALAVMASGMVSLGIATAYERHYGVLKRLGATPLPRWALLAAKAISVLGVEAGQVALLVAIAALYGWRPSPTVGLASIPIMLGTCVFAGIGLGMAGAWRAEATLAGANGLYLACLLIGDGVLPLDHLPGPLHLVAAYLPPALLTDSLRAAMSSHATVMWEPILFLAVWAAVIVGVAARTFRWE